MEFDQELHLISICFYKSFYHGNSLEIVHNIFQFSSLSKHIWIHFLNQHIWSHHQHMDLKHIHLFQSFYRNHHLLKWIFKNLNFKKNWFNFFYLNSLVNIYIKYFDLFCFHSILKCLHLNISLYNQVIQFHN